MDLNHTDWNVVLTAASLACNGIIAIWVRPLRKAHARITELEKHIHSLQVAGISNIVTAHGQQLGELRTQVDAVRLNCPICSSEVAGTIDEKLGRIVNEAAEGRERVHERLAQIEKEVTEVKTTTSLTREWVTGLDKRLDERFDKLTEQLAQTRVDSSYTAGRQDR
jgi:DNA repair exonuclease SbcCD ATPase subunit